MTSWRRNSKEFKSNNNSCAIIFRMPKNSVFTWTSTLKVLLNQRQINCPQQIQVKKTQCQLIAFGIH